MVLVYQGCAINGLALLGRTHIEMNLGARTTRTCIAHLPEIVFLVSFEDSLGINELGPAIVGFLIEQNIGGGIAFKHSDIQLVFGQTVHFGHQFPSPGNGVLLEEIAKAPVAQHFKHGVVVMIVSYLLQIIVFSAYAQAFLRVHNTLVGRFCIAQKVVFELIHARIGKHEGWIAFHNDG